MTQEEYNKLIEQCQPHPVFNRTWKSYSSVDYAATFLFKVKGQIDESTYVFDGANLFTKISRTKNKVLTFGNFPEVLNVKFYSYPKGVDADIKSNLVIPSKNEICAFMIANIDDSISFKLKFGDYFRMFLNDKKYNTNTIENSSFPFTINEVQENLEPELSHDSLMRFVLKAIGVKETYNLKEKLLQGLRDAFDVIKLKFPAGFNHSKKHPNAFGHGDIELKALTQAGYSKKQIYQIYYGNWLRDYSQVIVPETVGFNERDYKYFKAPAFSRNKVIQKFLPSMRNKPSQEKWVEVLHILAVKEFVYNLKMKKGKVLSQKFSTYKDEFKRLYGDFNKNVLGLYRPEEHLDNPKGLNDYRIFSDENLENPIVYKYEYPKGKFTTKKLYAGTNPASLQIDDMSQMKRYLLEDLDDGLRPSAFTYFEQQLRLARQKGTNREGFRHFGAALHVLEDYFAHSNFIEIALIKNGYTKVFPWVQLPQEIVDIEKGKDRAPKIPVVTGLFGTDDTLASIAPKLADELFPKDFEAYYSIKPLERTFFDALFTTLLEGVAENQKNVPEKDKLRYLGLSVQNILDMYNNYLGWRDEWAKQKENPYYGWIIEGISRALHFLGQSIQFYNNILFNIILSTVEDGIKEEQTRTNQNFGTDPTHTQIAKDAFDHPLNPLAGNLAVMAVYDIGRRMKTGMPIDSLVKYAKKTYFNHPSRVTWMDSTIESWAKQNVEAVKEAQSKTKVYHHEKQVKRTLEQFEKELEELKNPPKN
ncbi:HET-C-related protein [Psychroserpens algicola]|uniref:HET-C-related protein n=1 Tax=Psychroserpens algicola TaxID=1719034 RepID=UPI0019535AAE|nr:HET-C-related protein [Psychroserpens algicola]